MSGARGINFAQGVPWAAYSQSEALRWARSSEVTPLTVRVLLAAMARLDRTGHAPFGPGELADVLGGVDRSTGEVLKARGDSVSRAIAGAKRLGFVAEESTARCLVLPGYAFQRAFGAAGPCPIHGAGKLAA